MKGIKYCGECGFYDWEKCLLCENDGKLTGPFFDNCPLPDVEEVRHGYWIYHNDDLFPSDSTQECSLCHAEQNLFCDDDYCPNCGAKMDGKEG